MYRKSIMLCLTLSCVFAYPGTGRAEPAMTGVTSVHTIPGYARPCNAHERTKSCSDPVIFTEDGPLRGVTAPDINQYLGIPYAAPPVGPLRWTPPRPHGRWKGVLSANQPGNMCPQLDLYGNTVGNEDCLFLNVYTPGLKKNQERRHGLPVMVWIHGGSLVGGSGGEYDPSPLVTKGGVIVVTINYRLGALGFFAHPALDAEGHLNANYGLMDQQLALQWVKRNIVAFGGDPHRVTIFGESAGGQSVISNLASPTAVGLFHRAIAQSGAYGSFSKYDQTFFNLPFAEYLGSILAEQFGCGSQTAECLRATSDAVIVRTQPEIFYPMIDGNVLSQPPDESFAGGRFNRVPVIIGQTHDESRLSVAVMYDYKGKPLTDADYPEAVAKGIGRPVDDPFTQLLLQVYPLSNYPPQQGGQSAPLALGTLWTDVGSCQERNAARLLAGYVPTYMYEFDDQNAPLGWLPPASFPLGAYHSSELQYLFKPVGIPSQLNHDQEQLSDTMIAYWTRFAANGNPNLRDAPNWPPYDTGMERVQSLEAPLPSVKYDYDADHKCTSFWNTF